MPRTTTLDPERQLMIKAKACRRIAKEHEYYKKEVKENEAKLEAMKEAKKDPHDIKKFEEVLGESYMMVPDSQERLKKSLNDLLNFLSSEEYQASRSSEWEAEANQILKSHNMSSEDAEVEDTEVQETDVANLKDDEAF